MAIVVLVLWMFTAGAGFSLLVSSNLGRSRPAPAATPVAAASTAAAPAPVAAASTAAALAPVAAMSTAAAPAPATASVTTAPTASAAASVTTASTDSGAAPAASAPAASKRELKRAARDRFDPPSLTAAKSAPMVPGLRSLLEFAHPAFAIVGLGFWLCFTLVHQRVLGWIAFGLVTATVGLGLTWFTANARAAKAKRRDQGEPPPSFGIRLVVLHGGAATVTFALAALTALVLSR
jgi:hypothetical protein